MNITKQIQTTNTERNDYQWREGSEKGQDGAEGGEIKKYKKLCIK